MLRAGNYITDRPASLPYSDVFILTSDRRHFPSDIFILTTMPSPTDLRLYNFKLETVVKHLVSDTALSSLTVRKTASGHFTPSQPVVISGPAGESIGRGGGGGGAQPDSEKDSEWSFYAQSVILRPVNQ